jgi:hypothetical protein
MRCSKLRSTRREGNESGSIEHELDHRTVIEVLGRSHSADAVNRGASEADVLAQSVAKAFAAIHENNGTQSGGRTYIAEVRRRCAHRDDAASLGSVAKA